MFDMLSEAPVKANIKLLRNQEEILDDPDRYRRLVGKTNYLTISRPDIASMSFSQHQIPLIEIQ